MALGIFWEPEEDVTTVGGLVTENAGENPKRRRFDRLARLPDHGTTSGPAASKVAFLFENCKLDGTEFQANG